MAQIFDMHCHPAMKYYMRNEQNFYSPHPLSNVCSPLSIYYDVPGMRDGGVKVIFNFHYVPENGFHKTELFKLLSDVDVDVNRILEDPDQVDASTGVHAVNDSAWNKLLDSMKHMEDLILQADSRSAETGVNIVLVKKPDQFDDAFNGKNNIVIISAIEGSHHLGRNHGNDPQPYIDKLKILKANGICAYTLSHFFNNDICDSAGGIPPGDTKLINYSIPPPIPGLTPVGEKVVEFVLNNGFLIDLVHSTKATRQTVYNLNKQNKNCPLAFTHTGLLELYKGGKDARPDSFDYLASNDDIDAIAACKGILGIILMRNWLCGIDDDKPCDDDIINSIGYIIDRTGCDDYVGIGTDLDGFTHVPDNLSRSAKLSHLGDIITGAFGAASAGKILSGNALRVLKSVWK